MRIAILTIFPEMFESVLHSSILGRAREEKLVEIEPVDIRPFSDRKHKNTDDYPFGGGAGMVMLAQPICDAVRHLRAQGYMGKCIYMSPKKVRRLAFKSAMTSKLNAGEIIVVDELKLAEAKTKLMAKFLGNFETKNTTMLVLPGRDETILRAAGNIEKLETSYVNTLNVYDILKAGKIILTKDALKGVEEVYA